MTFSKTMPSEGYKKGAPPSSENHLLEPLKACGHELREVFEGIAGGTVLPVPACSCSFISRRMT